MKRILTFIFCMLCLGSTFAQRSKMSPLVRQAAMEGSMGYNVSMSKGYGTNTRNIPCLTAFVQTSDESVLYNHGCQVLAQWDDIFIAAIPLTEIDALAAEKQVSRIEAGRSCMLTNDTTATITRARDVWSSPMRQDGYTGKGVIVGVMDVGFDLTNPTYYSADGKTYRVKRMWDMLDKTNGGEQMGYISGGDTVIVGRQYIGYDSLMRKAHSTDGLIQYHGSHTSGTAAGSGAPFLCKAGEPVYSGMAPDADICLVSNAVSGDESLVSEDDEYKYTTATDMLGFKYIFDYADSVGKPCVISFSEGSYEDLYQSGIYNKVMSKLVGPGHIFCGSAGNEATKGTYMHKEKGESMKGAFLANSDSVSLYVLRSPIPPVITLRFYDNDTTVKEWQYDEEGLREYPDSFYMDTISVNDKKFRVVLNMYPSCYNDSLFATDLYVFDLQNRTIGTTPVVLILTGEDNDVEVMVNYGRFTSNSMDSTLKDYANTHNVLFPGCLDDVICVGAAGFRPGFYNTAGHWISPFGLSGGVKLPDSSIGPSMNCHVKPDVMAPGINILSSYSSYYAERDPYTKASLTVFNQSYNGRTYPYVALTGTSMATPVVAGIVALWLQACPTLTPDDVRDVIVHTSSHLNNSMTWPNNSYGYGEIDAKAGLDYIHKNFFAASDINKDAKTNVLDVNAVISAICGDGTYCAFADVNGDGNIDVLDVNAVISVICGVATR